MVPLLGAMCVKILPMRQAHVASAGEKCIFLIAVLREVGLLVWLGLV